MSTNGCSKPGSVLPSGSNLNDGERLRISRAFGSDARGIKMNRRVVFLRFLQIAFDLFVLSIALLVASLLRFEGLIPRTDAEALGP